ncbi:MAG TPA: efflux RND transporter permease subunit [Candidatus Acidoferrales bacterium]|jgi:CzcA family heavy metal efflux pump|nr:efflux RND transporter permease subunit [Candidatus Acidoferrales bacterium]
MWIVRLALRRPYTFVVASILILILGVVSITRTPVDIFPNIDIPVVSVLWQYTGLSPEEMSDRIVYNYERSLTTTVNNIEHIESQSLNGRAIVKIFFQPGVQISNAVAQVTAISQSSVHSMPPGTQPPFIIQYSASTVPVLQLGISGQGLSEQELGDLSQNFLRVGLITIPGVAVPYPYGGKQRQIQVDLNTQAMQAEGLSPVDVQNAIADQNLILPAGTAKIGSFEYQVDMNGAPQTIQELNDLPVKQVGNSTIYIHDVANVRDGFPPQTNIVRVDGKRAALLSILKNGDVSTLDIISNVKKLLPTIEAGLPPTFRAQPLSDQSIFVLAAIHGVVREGVIAGCLTGLMILVFLGSWRSTLIIAVSIPLSVLTSLVVLSALGQTINIMTLGGLALAVGILVDDATVEVENINRNLDQGKEIIQAILDGASQIAVPALVSTLSICIVFVPMFFLSGVAKYLFVPLAEAVVFAMMASYLLSRTLVPTMARYLLLEQTEEERKELTEKSRNPFVRMQSRFEIGFERFREKYHGLLTGAIHHRKIFAGCFLSACVLSFALIPLVGQDFFPRVDSGEFSFHMRAPTGTRIEETAALCDRVEADIRSQIPRPELVTIIDNIGLPYSSINLSYSNSAPIGTGDADILVELAPKHRPTEEYVRELRTKLNQDFPGVQFYDLPTDMVSNILNFGLPAPIDVQIAGRDLLADRQFADNLLNELKVVPGIVDLRIQQMFNEPRLHIQVDRTKAKEVGFNAADIAQSLLISLSGSFQTQPTFWLDPRNGVSYNITTQTPEYRNDSLQKLENIPVTGAGTNQSEILASLASFSRGSEMAVVSHYNVEPVIDIFGAVDGRDLGGVARDIMPIVNRSRKELPRGSQINVLGQINTMNQSFIGLLSGLGFSIVLVYLLIVVNFQSWLDPFIILMALPAALAGIVWCLFVTGTTISVPALTGAIMCIGVATSNSILVISFSKEKLQAGKTAAEAALEAGFTRFRPVLMTALAMIIGMLPMSLGLGEGGEQNAPLGRAVIGGLVFATVATLFFVPVVFSLVHGWREEDAARELSA